MQDLFGNELIEPIHYLTWHQPFASLMLHRKKETRNRPTNVRGKVLILSSLNPYPQHELFQMCGTKMMKFISDTLQDEPTKDITGHAIAIGNLIDCKLMKKGDEKSCFIKYKRDRYMWIFENVQRIEPISFKGQQGWGIIKDPIQLSKIKLVA